MPGVKGEEGRNRYRRPWSSLSVACVRDPQVEEDRVEVG